MSMNIENQKHTLLYIEDEAPIQMVTSMFLEPYFSEIFEASNGIEAMKIYENKNPDVIITDIEMPKVNGLELIESIRKKDKETAIIIISGYSDKDKLLRAIKLNLVDYIIKPFTREGILSTITDIFKEKDQVDDEIVILGNYSFNFSSKVISFEEHDYPLTTKQSHVLMFFIHNANVILSPVDIYYYLYPNYNKEYSNASIRNIIKRLRTILPEGTIESIYSEGYRFNVSKL